MDLANGVHDLSTLIAQQNKEGQPPIRPVIFAKWLLCHLSDAQVTALLDLLASENAVLFIVDTAAHQVAKDALLVDGTPFYVRTLKAWLDLFSEKFTVVESALPAHQAAAPQMLFYLETSNSKKRSQR